MKNFTLIMLFLTTSIACSLFSASTNASNQEKYLINDISPSYYAKIEADKVGYHNSAIIRIYQRKNSKPLFQVNAKMFSLDFESENKNITPTNLPYAKQDVIIYDDFNFDRVKDFAVFDGRNSCYGGPSYQVYLANGGTFKLSPSFTKLAQNYCGMFYYFADKKQLQVSMKSGCCNFQTSTFMVKNNQPKAIKILNESYKGYYLESETSLWNGSRMVKNKQRTIYDEGSGSIQEVLVFSLAKNSNKQVKLFITTDDKMLNYAFINQNNVEFNYPKMLSDSNPFIFIQSFEKPHTTSTTKSDSRKMLVFYNGKTKYSLYQNEDAKGITKVGILVTANGKNYDLIGDLATLKGRLDGFDDQVTNVSY